MPRWFRVHSIHQIRRLHRSKCVGPTVVILALLFLVPTAAMAQGSPFDTGFNAIQSLFTGTIAKVASLVAIVIGGDSGRELPYKDISGQPGHEPGSLPRGVSSERH